MTRPLASVLLGALLCCHTTLAAAAPAADIELPTAQVERVVLPNGLILLLEEDHRVPLVAFAVRIRGGANAEGARLGGGGSHFIEHILFKGTATRPVGAIDREVRSYGGDIGAFTGSDYTGVNVTVGKPYAGQAAALLADVLQHATFDQAEIDKERLVIHSEMQMRRDDPGQYLHEQFNATAYRLHPYHESVLGRQALFDHLTREDLLAIYHQQYVANNMTIAVIGDFATGETLPALRRAFETMTSGAPLPLAYPEEPEQVNTRRLVERRPVHVSHLLIGFHSTAMTDVDTYALDVLAQALGEGESARLVQRLRAHDRLVYSIEAWNYTPVDPGIFGISATGEEANTEAALAAIHDEIARVQQHGLSPQELEKAKRQVLAGYVFGRQTIQSKADDLALNELTTGDYDFSRTYVDGIQQVTSQEVQTVAQRYLTPENETIAALHPEAAAVVTAPAATESLPTVQKTVLPNGITVLTQEDHRLPIVSMLVAAPGGLRAETAQTNGLSNLMARWMLRGTRKHSARQIAELVESWGGQVGAFSGRDAWGLQLQVLRPQATDGLALLAELLTQPAWSAQEGAQLTQEIAAEIRAQQDDIFFVAGQRLREGLFAAHPYRWSALGTEASVAALTVDTVRAFHRQVVRPERLVVAVFGDISAADAAKQITQRFGTLPKDTGPSPEAPALEPPLAASTQLAATAPKQQSVLMVGFRGARWTDEDRYPLELLSAWLSGLGGTLFDELRDQQGLAYTLGAYPIFGRDPGLFVYYVATRPDDLDRTQQALRRFLQQLARKTIDPQALDSTKAHLLGEFRSQLQSTATWALRCALDELQGVGFDAYRQYEARINRLQPADLERVINQYITSAKSVTVRVEPPQASHADASTGTTTTE